MRPTRVLLLLFILAMPALAAEVLVLTTVTQVDAAASRNRKGFEIQNNGTADIWCELTNTPVVGRSRKVATGGGTWSASATTGQTVKCIGTANQVADAGTNYSEVL